MKNILAIVGSVLVMAQYVVLGLMGYELFCQASTVNTVAKTTIDIIAVQPHEAVETLNDESVSAPIEECGDNPRACRWAQGEHDTDAVLRYTKSSTNLTSGRAAIIATIKDVRNRLTLVPNVDSVSNLVYRTFIHESLLGTIDFTNKNGQGIGQLTLKHAKDVLKRISRRSPENFAIIAEISEISNPLTLSDKDLLKELHTNLKLQVALCILTYWFRDPKFYQKAGSLEQDAVMWKKLYNTELGKGTAEAFIASCNAHM